jgi:amidase
MAGRMRRKEVSAVEVVEDAIRKAEALQPKIGALVTSDFDRALDKAKAGQLSGPFAGVPFLIKDLDPYKGLPTRYGSRSGWAPPETSPDRLYRRLRPGRLGGDRQVGDAGIRLPADHRADGLPADPQSVEPEALVGRLVRRRGGRRGLGRMVPFAHASDGGGSIRIPLELRPVRPEAFARPDDRRPAQQPGHRPVGGSHAFRVASATPRLCSRSPSAPTPARRSSRSAWSRRR